MQFIIHCKNDELVNPKELKDNPQNRNKHGSDQVERLADIYKYQGIRHPVIVSKLSGKIVAGHGRKLAAIRAGIEKFPVVYQQFESKEQEYLFIQSDNAIALWAELDFSSIGKDIMDFENEIDIKNLGIKNFFLGDSDISLEEQWDGMPEFDQDDKNSFRKVIVHFEKQEDVESFFKILGQSFTDKTKSIWHPEQQRMDTESKRYE